jgi:hypothetical protein
MDYCDDCSVELTLSARCTDAHRTMEVTSRNLVVIPRRDGQSRGDVGKPLGESVPLHLSCRDVRSFFFTWLKTTRRGSCFANYESARNSSFAVEP